MLPREGGWSDWRRRRAAVSRRALEGRGWVRGRRTRWWRRVVVLAVEGEEGEDEGLAEEKRLRRRRERRRGRRRGGGGRVRRGRGERLKKVRRGGVGEGGGGEARARIRGEMVRGRGRGGKGEGAGRGEGRLGIGRRGGRTETAEDEVIERGRGCRRSVCRWVRGEVGVLVGFVRRRGDGAERAGWRGGGGAQREGAGRGRFMVSRDGGIKGTRSESNRCGGAPRGEKN
ncbi:uncharacterized protein A4U43_C08F12240 [Asparagus officinalis]|nr:uncharacterized protein A4U43_C08F12240 [Asparagus officinalis]